jgi:hypothetical protein
MSKRLQVLLEEEEFERLRAVARTEGVTVSEHVRSLIRRDQRDRPSKDVASKLEAIHEAMQHNYPTADIEQMLEEIERGYLS